MCCSFVAFILTYFFVDEVSSLPDPSSSRRLPPCAVSHTKQTARLSLEEISAIFGDTVVVSLTNATAEEKARIDAAIVEKSAHEHIDDAQDA